MQKYLKIGYYLQEIKNNNQYENYSFFFLVSICLFFRIFTKRLPRTSKKHTDYFIQHSDNHNTYVYDANIKAGIIDSSQPINTYRIVYTKWYKTRQGFPWNDFIRFKTTYSKIAQEKNIFLSIMMKEGARIYVIVNKHKMYLDKMSIQLKNGIFGINLGFSMFYFMAKIIILANL
jgi:hypothetical protein